MITMKWGLVVSPLALALAISGCASTAPSPELVEAPAPTTRCGTRTRVNTRLRACSRPNRRWNGPSWRMRTKRGRSRNAAWRTWRREERVWPRRTRTSNTRGANTRRPTSASASCRSSSGFKRNNKRRRLVGNLGSARQELAAQGQQLKDQQQQLEANRTELELRKAQLEKSAARANWRKRIWRRSPPSSRSRAAW